MHVELEADSLNSLFCSTSQSLYQKLTRRIKIKMQFKDKEEHLTYTQETKLIIKKSLYIASQFLVSICTHLDKPFI